MNDELKVVNIRLVEERTLFSERKLSTPTIAVEVIAKEIAQYDREVFCVLNLQTDNRPISMNIVSMGGLSEVLVLGREVFKSSILSNAKSIMLLHNHPSGSLQPSQEDINITSRMQQAGELLGIGVIDHIIVGGFTAERYSFLEEGLLNKNVSLGKIL